MRRIALTVFLYYHRVHTKVEGHMETVRVHPRVRVRHPGITDEDVVTAWNNFICRTRRVDTYDENFVAVGFDSTGRLLEMVGVQLSGGGWFIFHAMKATPKALAELDLM
jgi:hypothetical protein